MDWREGRPFNSNCVTFQNVLLPRTNDFNDRYLSKENSVSPDVSKHPIHKSSTSNGIDSSIILFLTTWLVDDGVLFPKLMQFSKAVASNDEEMRDGYLWIEGNKSCRSSHYRSWFHRMIIEGYLHQSNTKSILSRITDPIFSKFSLSPLNSVNEERSIHS